MERGLDPSRWVTSAYAPTILDKPTSAVKYASGLVSKTQSKILYPFSSLEVAEKLAANHLHIAVLPDNYGIVDPILYRRLNLDDGLFRALAGSPRPLNPKS